MTSPVLARDATPANAVALPFESCSEPAEAAPFPVRSPTMSLGLDPAQIIRSRFLLPFADGREPECRVEYFRCRADGGCDVPESFVVARHGEAKTSVSLVETPTVTALIQHTCGVGGAVTVRARTAAVAEQGLAEILAWFPDIDHVNETLVDVGFWQRAQTMYLTNRSIEAPAWADVQAHYPSEVQDELDQLMATSLDAPAGRIMLWHGPPGTGKTTAIRTLARAWRDQANAQVVLDPESVFTDAAAMMQVLLDTRSSSADQWRVLVIEDADELVRAGNNRAGRSLSRLLNVGDGIVGQGLKVLILLTTNEPPERLHPALSRPGRCMSKVYFRKFRRAEAQTAFAHLDGLPDGQELALADIMNGRISTPEEPAAIGTYL